MASRKEFRAHATAGAVLVGPDGRILHIRHLALDKWLLPGGHLEPEDDTLQEAALRELCEETGVPADSVASAAPGPDWGRGSVPTLRYSGRNKLTAYPSGEP
ncbi:NUDIX domain-containing protein [Kitasatospora albolonga]